MQCRARTCWWWKLRGTAVSGCRLLRFHWHQHSPDVVCTVTGDGDRALGGV